MIDGNRVLALVVAASKEGKSLSVGQIAAHASRATTRKHALECLGRLMQRKLIARDNAGPRQNIERVEPLYRATNAGIAFVEAGKRFTSGPNGPLACPVRKRKTETFRSRLWRAFRVQKKATLPQLIEIARIATDGRVENNALKFLKALVRAGVAARLPTREPGFAPSSNGFVRFALIRDLGPHAPVIGFERLIDPNAEGDARFIPYTRSSSEAVARQKDGAHS